MTTEQVMKELEKKGSESIKNISEPRGQWSNVWSKDR